MDLYSSNVGSIHGNMRNKARAEYNSHIIDNNNALANTIAGLKEQQKENEYLSSAKNLVSSAYSGGAYATKLAEHKAFTEAGGSGFGIKQAYRNLRANPEGSLEAISNRVVERVNPEGVQQSLSQAQSPLDAHVEEHGTPSSEAVDNPMAEGRAGVSEAEHGEEMASSLGREGVSSVEGGAEALASTGKWVGRVGKGLGIAGGLATGGMALADDFKGGFHIAGHNTAEKIANVGQIIGAGLDVVGTIAPPLALLGGVVDILSGIIGGAGNIEEGEDAEKKLDKQEVEQKQKEVEVSSVGAQQITTGRTM